MAAVTSRALSLSLDMKCWRSTPTRRRATSSSKERYQHTKRRLGRQRGPKVAQIDLSRKLIEAIWHMLTRNQPFSPAGAPIRLAAWRLSMELHRRTSPPIQPSPRDPTGR